MSDLPSSRAELTEAIRGGQRFQYSFFWGHRVHPGGQLTETCFSQWYPAPFELHGERFPTAEHYMMAEKATLFGDSEMRARILEARSPSAAKALGRKVQNFSEERWRERRFEIVVAGNIAKFGQNAALGSFLLQTRERILVEASPVDRVWGIGLSRDDPRSQDPATWRGDNLLGFALMAARGQLASAVR